MANVGKLKRGSSNKRLKKTGSFDAGLSSKVGSANPEAAAGAIGDRDGTLDLFHSLGKVLYCKRDPETKETFNLGINH